MAVINHLPQAADPPLRDAGDPLPDLILHSRNDTGPPASGPIPAQAEPAARPDLLQLISITYLSGFLYFFVVFYQVEDSVIIFTIKKIIQIFLYTYIVYTFNVYTYVVYTYILNTYMV